MICFYSIDGVGPVYYFDGCRSNPLSCQDEMDIINTVYKANTGQDIPCFSWYSVAPWYTRLEEGCNRAYESE